MKRLLAVVLITGGVLMTSALPALAANPGTNGQPDQSCQSFFGDSGPFTPGGFNTAGFTKAATVYAGSQPQNSQNPMSVSQYDVACFQAASR